MEVDSHVATGPESNQETSQESSSGEVSSPPAAAPPPQQGAQSDVVGLRLASNYSAVDAVLHGQRRVRRGVEHGVEATAAEVEVINGTLAETKAQKVNEKREQLTGRDGSSDEKPSEKQASVVRVPEPVLQNNNSNSRPPPQVRSHHRVGLVAAEKGALGGLRRQFSIGQVGNEVRMVSYGSWESDTTAGYKLVSTNVPKKMKVVASRIRSRTTNLIHYPVFKPDPPMDVVIKMAREKEESCTIGVIFAEWKLDATAFLPLPLVPSLNSHVPWFFMANPETSLGNHIFGNMETQLTVLVANPDLQSSSCLLHSKEGWLLLQGQEWDRSFSGKFPRYPVFLLNPTTGARIDLPSLCFQGCQYAAFATTAEGTPDLVIIARDTGLSVSLLLARPGGAYWEEHPYGKRCCFGRDRIHSMVLCGGCVYCFLNHSTLVFELAARSWCHFTHEAHASLPYQALEVEGKVVMVGTPSDFFSDRGARGPITFYRIEICGDKLEWVEITGSEELDGRIWFIHRQQSFCVKVAGSGSKVCWFASRAIGHGCRHYRTAYALHCCDMTTWTHRRLTADSVLCGQYVWVDLGSCSGHGLFDRGITADDLLPGF